MIAEEIAALDEAKDPNLKKMIEDYNKIKLLAIGRNAAFSMENLINMGVTPSVAERVHNAWLDLFNGRTNSAYKQVGQLLNNLEKEGK